MAEIDIKINIDSESSEADIKRLKRAFDSLGRTAQDSSNRIRNSFRRAFNGIKDFFNAVKKGANSIKNVFKSLIGTIGNFIGIASFEELIRTTQKTASGFISLENTLRALGKSNEVAAKSIMFLRKEATFLGADFNTLTKAYTKFIAAGVKSRLTSKELHTVFSAIAETGVILQFSTQQLEGAFRALTQMMSKGKVQAEELRGQLGEHLPGAFEIAAESMGKTTKELDEMLKQGQITAEMLLREFGQGLRDAYGKALPGAIRTSTAEFARLRSEVAFFFLEYKEKFDQFFGTVARGLRQAFINLRRTGLLDDLLNVDIGLKAIMKTLSELPFTFQKLWIEIKYGLRILVLQVQKTWLEIQSYIPGRKGREAKAALRGNVIEDRPVTTFFGGLLGKTKEVEVPNEKDPNAIDDMINFWKLLREEAKRDVQALQDLKEITMKGRGEDPGFLTGSGATEPSRLKKRFKIFEAELNKVHREFEDGEISIERYNRDLSETITKFEEVAVTGNKTFAGLTAGSSLFFAEYGNHMNNIREWTEASFSGLTDAITDTLADGKSAFRDFAESILKDLLRIYIRASIVLPMARQLGFAGPSATIDAGSYIAQSGATVSSLPSEATVTAIPLAAGGIVTSPTLSIVGEKAPEAVIPLSMLPSLGGATTVIVQNNTSATATQETTTGPDGEELITVIIEDKLSKMSQNGKLDKVMTPYNVYRKGQR